MIRKRILAVDDNDTNLDILREILDDDYRLEMARDGAEALAKAREFRPDLILLDVMMPELDGLEVCRRLRASTGGYVKIIMVSAKISTADRLAGYEAGADDYITKPFDEDELLAKVRVHLRLKSVEEVDHVKCRLLEVLQHGNRTPLTHILGAAELLQARGDNVSAEDRKEWLNNIVTAAQRLQRWVERAEVLVALLSGRVDLEFQEVDLRPLVEGIAAGLAVDFNQRVVAINLYLPEQALATCDPTHVETAISSVIHHALHRTVDERQVNVRLDASGDHWNLRVEDGGPTVTTEHLPNLFEPFADPDEVLHNRGDGLGLAIAREVTLAHDGWVRAQPIEKGGLAIQLEMPKDPVPAEAVALAPG